MREIFRDHLVPSKSPPTDTDQSADAPSSQPSPSDFEKNQKEKGPDLRPILARALHGGGNAGDAL